MTDQVNEAVAWTDDAQKWGKALNEASWTFIETCPEKSPLLFNTAKGALRAAILRYAEFVAAVNPALAHPSRGVVDDSAIHRALEAYTAINGLSPIEKMRAALQAAALPAVPVGMVLVPKHYAENVGYAAVMLEGSESAIDRLQAPALHALVKLLAATPAHDQPEGDR